MDKVPVLDLKADHQSQVETLDAALRTFGFFYVKNHGLDQPVTDQFAMAKQLFDLPLDQKNAMPFDPQLDIGYVGQHGQNLDPNNRNTTTYTKEQFMQTNNILITSTEEDVWINPHNVFETSQNYKPPIPDYTTVTGEYANKAYALNQTLNNLLFDALQLDTTTRSHLGHQPFLVLKQMKYAGEPSDLSIGKLGAGAHTDWGSFTILATDQTPGLQILIANNWLPVPPQTDCLIINSGDQIAHLTNGVYRSALHRVVTTSTKPRYSTAVFTYFNMQALVGPLPQFVNNESQQQQQQQAAKFPHRTTKEYFHFKLHESFGVAS